MTDQAARVFVLGLDGVPHSLIERFVDAGVMPRLGAVIARGAAVQYDSILPTVSNVAWASFQTGRRPAKFDIFGFAEVDHRMQLRLPNASHGVPSSYPPRQINGLLVGGFLAPQLAKAVYPPQYAAQLAQRGYELDIDPTRARGDIEYLKRAALEVLDGRRRVTEALLAGETWDLFVLHVMETDRVNHFMWALWEDGPEAEYFESFYRRVDDLIGRIDSQLGDDDVLIILSDHGFCRIRHEVELNRRLKAEGYLRTEGDPTRMFGAISADSAAFALVPGRVHILRNDVYDRGCVSPADYESLRSELMARLALLTDPDTGEPVCRRVLTREEAFDGPYIANAPDIVLDPNPGYDFKAALTGEGVFSSSPISGMHTVDDAFLCVRGRPLTDERRCVTDVTRSILDLLGVPAPADLDSRGVLAG